MREIVPAAKQREALTAVLETIKPAALAIPQRILDLIPPRAFGYGGGTAEYFGRRTSPDFDPIGAATIAADLAISPLLNPQRAARLVQFNAQDRSYPHFSAVTDALVRQIWTAEMPRDAYQAAILEAEQSLLVTRLMELAGDANATPVVRGTARAALKSIAGHPAQAGTPGFRQAIFEEIRRFLERPEVQHKPSAPLATPAGDPIGSRQ